MDDRENKVLASKSSVQPALTLDKTVDLGNDDDLIVQENDERNGCNIHRKI